MLSKIKEIDIELSQWRETYESPWDCFILKGDNFEYKFSSIKDYSPPFPPYNPNTIFWYQTIFEKIINLKPRLKLAFFSNKCSVINLKKVNRIYEEEKEYRNKDFTLVLQWRIRTEGEEIRSNVIDISLRCEKGIFLGPLSKVREGNLKGMNVFSLGKKVFLKEFDFTILEKVNDYLFYYPLALSMKKLEL